MSDYLFYSNLYIYGSFLIILFYSLRVSGNNYILASKKSFGAEVLLILITLYMGKFPYSIPGDRNSYVSWYLNGYDNMNDPFWTLYNTAIKPFQSPDLFLFLTAFIYVFGFYHYSKRIHPQSATIMMMGFLGFLFFQGYGVNTMRAGVAASLIFYGLTNNQKTLWKYLAIFYIAINIHLSMLLPVIALLLSKYYKSTKHYFYFWLLCIPLSFVAGGYLQGLLAPFVADYTDDRAAYLTELSGKYQTGFRVDFIFYSIIPGIMAYFYVFKKKIKDEFYLNIFNAYLIANSFWILVIRADFSDRIAYLSWMFIPVLLLYPPLKYRIWRKQNTKIALILFGQALFTFLLNIR